MSRLATFAAEIEKYLHWNPRALEDEEEETASTRAKNARRRIADFQAMNLYAAGEGGDKSVSGTRNKQSAKSRKLRQSPSIVQPKSGNGLVRATGLSKPVSTNVGQPRQNTVTRPAVTSLVKPIALPGTQNALPIAIYNLVRNKLDEDEDLQKRSVRGGSSRNPDQEDELHSVRGGGKPHTSQSFSPLAKLNIASRAGTAVGAQPAVFKILSTMESKLQAGKCIDYIGTRDGEDGKKDIEAITSEGAILADAEMRRAFLNEFADTFDASLLNTNFFELSVTLPGDQSDQKLSSALTDALGSKPFVFCQESNNLKIFVHLDDRAGPVATALAKGRGNSRSQSLNKLETKLTNAFERAGVNAKIDVVGAVSDERKAKYFLQKFIRNNPDVREPSGDSVRNAKNPQKAAQALFEQWRPQMTQNKRRNAYHLLFSGRAGTDPVGLLNAARSVLEENAPGHKFILAHHSDTKHVHVHAMVQARNEDGERLRFSKPQLNAWRELFAEKARENGIAMVFTQRMEQATSRPYTQDQIGAYKRAQKDPRYSISDKLVQRVENKKNKIPDKQLLVANGAAIANLWQQTAHTMKAAGVSEIHAQAANNIGDNILHFSKDGGSNRTATDGNIRDPQANHLRAFTTNDRMKHVNALIGAMEMAETPLEMRQKMASVNRELDTMQGTLPSGEQAAFSQFRDNVNDRMHDRLARLQVEQQQLRKSGEGGSADGAQEKVAKSRDLPTREAEQTPERQVETDKKQARSQSKDADKQKARRAEEQNRKTQRSQDKDYER